MLLAYDLTILDSQGITNLMRQRLQDIVLGCAVGLTGTAVAFPREATAGGNDPTEGPMTRVKMPKDSM